MPITRLTIRQFLRSRSLLVVAIILLLPVILAIITHFVNVSVTVRDMQRLFSNAIFMGMFIGTLLPLGTLVLSTSALGDEIEDKTLHFLVLKPISRFRIVFEKWIAAIVTTLLLALMALAIIMGVLGWDRIRDLREFVVPALASTTVGVLGYGSLFLLLSLLFRRTLLFGVFYVFVWETSLARFLPGIRNISIGHYARSMYAHLLDRPNLASVDGMASMTTIIAATAGTVIVSLGLATWRLRSMAVE